MLYRGPLGGGAASGALGAMVASHNSGGQYLRARTTPTDPGSTYQTAVRNAVGNLATRWVESLTALQRTNWGVYASAVSVPNALGDLIILSGISMFIRCNSPRVQAGMPIVDDAPVVFTLGDFTGATLTTAAAATSGTLTYDGTRDWVGTSNANSGLLLYVSRPMSPSINFFKGPYRYADKINGTDGTESFALPFSAGPAGSKLFFRAQVSRLDGRLSTVFRGVSTI